MWAKIAILFAYISIYLSKKVETFMLDALDLFAKMQVSKRKNCSFLFIRSQKSQQTDSTVICNIITVS